METNRKEYYIILIRSLLKSFMTFLNEPGRNTAPRRFLNFINVPNYGWYFDHQPENDKGLTPGTFLVLHGWSFYWFIHKPDSLVGTPELHITVSKTSLRQTKTSRGW